MIAALLERDVKAADRPWAAEDWTAHAGAVRAYVRRRIDNLADVEDCVQEVYLRAVGRGGADIQNPRGFLLRIASSILVDRHRRRVARASDRHVGLDAVGGLHDDGAHSPERIAASRQELSRIGKALDTMSATAQDCFRLVRLEGLRPNEAARRLGLTEKSVTRHLERTLVRLTEALLEKR
jgi:RNA polymerase sigma-70 factor (ECF subfamily)